MKPRNISLRLHFTRTCKMAEKSFALFKFAMCVVQLLHKISFYMLYVDITTRHFVGAYMLSILFFKDLHVEMKNIWETHETSLMLQLWTTFFRKWIRYSNGIKLKLLQNVFELCNMSRVLYVCTARFCKLKYRNVLSETKNGDCKLQ